MKSACNIDYNAVDDFIILLMYTKDTASLSYIFHYGIGMVVKIMVSDYAYLSPNPPQCSFHENRG